jgi:hypothetical protein
LHLQALPDQVQRENAGFGKYAGKYTGYGIPRTKWQTISLA